VLLLLARCPALQWEHLLLPSRHDIACISGRSHKGTVRFFQLSSYS
jgi:hypothetical protein